MQWNLNSSGDSFEPISWPLRVASLVVLPISSLLLLALPLSIFYSYQFLTLDGKSTGVVVSINESEDDCVSEVRFEAKGELVSSLGDCIQKKPGKELTVRYDSENPENNTTKGPLFSLVGVPLFGILLTAFGLYVIINCFYFYRELLLRQIEKKQERDRERANRDSLHGEYDEDSWKEEPEDLL